LQCLAFEKEASFFNKVESVKRVAAGVMSGWWLHGCVIALVTDAA